MTFMIFVFYLSMGLVIFCFLSPPNMASVGELKCTKTLIFHCNKWHEVANLLPLNVIVADERGRGSSGNELRRHIHSPNFILLFNLQLTFLKLKKEIIWIYVFFFNEFNFSVFIRVFKISWTFGCCRLKLIVRFVQCWNFLARPRNSNSLFMF